MTRGRLHGLQHKHGDVSLVFSEFRPNGAGGPMKMKPFRSQVALAHFLKQEIGTPEDERNTFLEQLTSVRHATTDEVNLTTEQRLRFGL